MDAIEALKHSKLTGKSVRPKSWDGFGVAVCWDKRTGDFMVNAGARGELLAPSEILEPWEIVSRETLNEECD